MIQIKKFVFNPFQENTFVLYDETKEGIVIDPGCYETHEQEQISNFLKSEQINLVKLVYTHCHVDHILGNNYIAKTYELKPQLHKAGLPFFENGHKQGEMYGFSMEPSILPERFIDHNDIIKFGDSELKAVYTPGHVDGSICLVCQDQKFVITGDVLFKDSIGRTDFPTGDFDLLMKSIHTELFTLEDDFAVYCGHGPETSIGYEKVNNPFIRF